GEVDGAASREECDMDDGDERQQCPGELPHARTSKKDVVKVQKLR
ncbi:MAG: hypothetical protein HYV25_03335, partial [Candidatus Harrisonbacteria bacterium]|nr:hypothetical protein [Candidatus Harrisonbacteria bacterium]